MKHNYSFIYKYSKAQIGRQVDCNFELKKRSLNEHFSPKNYGQDASNLGFPEKNVDVYYEA
jgi:hypothetical protein